MCDFVHVYNRGSRMFALKTRPELNKAKIYQERIKNTRQSCGKFRSILDIVCFKPLKQQNGRCAKQFAINHLLLRDGADSKKSLIGIGGEEDVFHFFERCSTVKRTSSAPMVRYIFCSIIPYSFAIGNLQQYDLRLSSWGRPVQVCWHTPF